MMVGQRAVMTAVEWVCRMAVMSVVRKAAM